MHELHLAKPRLRDSRCIKVDHGDGVPRQRRLKVLVTERLSGRGAHGEPRTNFRCHTTVVIYLHQSWRLTPPGRNKSDWSRAAIQSRRHLSLQHHITLRIALGHSVPPAPRSHARTHHGDVNVGLLIKVALRVVLGAHLVRRVFHSRALVLTAADAHGQQARER